jgi:hypothetical protein
VPGPGGIPHTQLFAGVSTIEARNDVVNAVRAGSRQLTIVGGPDLNFFFCPGAGGVREWRARTRVS